jgi:hypothetical protein
MCLSGQTRLGTLGWQDGGATAVANERPVGFLFAWALVRLVRCFASMQASTSTRRTSEWGSIHSKDPTRSLFTTAWPVRTLLLACHAREGSCALSVCVVDPKSNEPALSHCVMKEIMQFSARRAWPLIIMRNRMAMGMNSHSTQVTSVEKAKNAVP